jgi:tetratricopeptide (TPR) repeat protein
VSAHRARAWLLYQQSRYEQALAELGRAFEEAPDDAEAHALASLCEANRDRVPESRRHAEAAIREAPDVSFSHYAMAVSLLKGNRYEDALAAAERALELDTEDVTNHALVATVHLVSKRYEEAIAAADRGLLIDPEDLPCTNVRAQALMASGRKGEAASALEDALADDPDSDMTHANLGWAHLRAGDPKRAKKHFVEALRLDPENDWARAGLAEALKAKNVVYRWMLKWYLWVGAMPAKTQWMLIIGLWLLFRVSRSISKSAPALAPWLVPLQIAYVLFCAMTWLADPVFNLLLLLDREGRYALAPRARRGAIAVGLLLLFGAANLVLAYATDLWAGLAEINALLALLYCVPLHAAFSVEPGWPTRVATLATVALLAMLLTMFALPLLALAWPGHADELAAFYVPLMWTALWGGIAALWGTNLLAQAEPKY